MKQPIETRIDKNKLQEKRKARWKTIGIIDSVNNKTIIFRGICTLCHTLVPVAKTSNKHHISYGDDTTVFMCYTCHNIFHWRLRFKTLYWKNYQSRYGEDFFAYFLCHDILRIFYKHPDVIAEIKRRFPEEFSSAY